MCLIAVREMNFIKKCEWSSGKTWFQGPKGVTRDGITATRASELMMYDVQGEFLLGR